MKVGFSFLVPSGPQKKLHLNVVLTEPDKHGMVITACICTIRREIYHDRSCILRAGCHEFISRESYAAYNFAEFRHNKHIKKMIDKNYYVKKPPASKDVVEALWAGFQKTEEAPDAIRNAFFQWLQNDKNAC